MKITAKYNNFSYSCPKRKPYMPSFGISFKAPKLLSDIFIRQSNQPAQKVFKLKKLKAGKFGTECKNSSPLKNFDNSVDFDKLKELYKNGFSTNTDGWADCFLKSKANNPLSTSSVYDCSVMYLFNKDTNTHFLYHSSFRSEQKDFDFLIKTFMPEGFTKAEILPGAKRWLERHSLTLPEMVKAIQSNNKQAEIKIRHYNSKMPEIVGYMGELYEIPNQRIEMGFYDKGQASFRMCDLKAKSLINELDFNSSSIEKIAATRQVYEQEIADTEILKIVHRQLDKNLEKLLTQNNAKK